jgi:oxygen-dependent protoporphyrinogen oxidase
MIMADGVVLATPATAMGRLLSSLVPSAEELASLPYASVAVITLVVSGFRASTSGVLVAPRELPTITAMTYSSAKWSWVASCAQQAFGPDVGIIRVSVGRRGEAAALQLNDRALLERTFAEAGTLPGWQSATLVEGAVSRWGGGLPQYPVGHRDLVARLRAEVAAIPGLAIAGAALDGIGIPACLASARTAVAALTADGGGMVDSEDQLEESGR